MNPRWNPFLRFPRAALLVSVLLCLPLLLSLTHLRVNSELRVLLEGDQRNLESYEKTRQILAGVEILVVSLEVPEVFSQAGLDAIRRVSHAFEGQAGVTDVKSLTHSSRPVRRGLAFEMVPFVPSEPLDADALRALKDYSMRNPLVRNLMVAPDSKHTMILVTYARALNLPEQQGQLREEIGSILAPFRAEGMRFQTLALPLIAEEVRQTLRADAVLMVPGALGLLAVVFWITFRSWRVLALILINQVGVVLLLPGLAQAAGYSLTVFSIMLLPLLTGIHLTLLAHVYTSFQRGRFPGESGQDGVERMLREVFKSCVFASLTTIIGLASLILSDVRQVRDFGILGSIGMIVIFFMTFGPGLALLRLVAGLLPLPPAGAPTGAVTSVEPGKTDWADACTRLIEKRSGAILTVSCGLLLLTVVGMGRVRTDIRAVEFLDLSSPTRQAVATLDQVYGGINVVRIEFDSGRDNGVNEDGFLAYLERVQRDVQARPEVSGVYSYAQLLAIMNQIWEGDNPAALKLPGNALLRNMFVLALKAQNFPFLTALADETFRTAHLVMQTRDMSADRYVKLVGDVVAYAQENKPAGVSISATRGMHSILEADRRIVRSQVDTLASSTAFIGVILMLLWRSPRLGLFALAINVIAVLLVLAVAGFADMPLNSITVMVAAVALGIAVDDSIHFITHWKEERARGAGPAQAIASTLRVKGCAIIVTSAALMAIFSIFAFSSFPPVVDFGVLSASAFAAALVSVLVLLPALLRIFPGKGGTGNGSSIQ